MSFGRQGEIPTGSFTQMREPSQIPSGTVVPFMSGGTQPMTSSQPSGGSIFAEFPTPAPTPITGFHTVPQASRLELSKVESKAKTEEAVMEEREKIRKLVMREGDVRSVRPDKMNPAFMALPQIRCTCNKITGKISYHEGLMEAIANNECVQCFFESIDFTRLCCRVTLQSYHMVPLGPSYYNERVAAGVEGFRTGRGHAREIADKMEYGGGTRLGNKRPTTIIDLTRGGKMDEASISDVRQMKAIADERREWEGSGIDAPRVCSVEHSECEPMTPDQGEYVRGLISQQQQQQSTNEDSIFGPSFNPDVPSSERMSKIIREDKEDAKKELDDNGLPTVITGTRKMIRRPRETNEERKAKMQAMLNGDLNALGEPGMREAAKIYEREEMMRSMGMIGKIRSRVRDVGSNRSDPPRYQKVGTPTVSSTTPPPVSTSAVSSSAKPPRYQKPGTPPSRPQVPSPSRRQISKGSIGAALSQVKQSQTPMSKEEDDDIFAPIPARASSIDTPLTLSTNLRKIPPSQRTKEMEETVKRESAKLYIHGGGRLPGDKPSFMPSMGPSQTIVDPVWYGETVSINPNDVYSNIGEQSVRSGGVGGERVKVLRPAYRAI